MLSHAERERTAYHEAGHALLGMLIDGSDPVRKLSIIPRRRALGVTFQSPDADRYGYSADYLRAVAVYRLSVALDPHDATVSGDSQPALGVLSAFVASIGATGHATGHVRRVDDRDRDVRWPSRRDTECRLAHVSPVALILLAIGGDRLLSLGRPHLLQPAQRRWIAARPRVFAWVRSAPLTYGYLVILLVTTWVLASANGQLANRLLLAQSTNLHHLARDPVRVLISSAFWNPGTFSPIVWAALLTLVLAPVERRIGSWRLGIVFAVGHVGATLVTAAGLWAALWLDTADKTVANARDVGASYGLLAVAAAMTYLLAPRLRIGYAVVLLASLAAVAAVSHTFTDFGHLVTVLLGFCCYRLVRGHTSMAPIDLPALRPHQRRRPSRLPAAR